MSPPGRGEEFSKASCKIEYLKLKYWYVQVQSIVASVITVLSAGALITALFARHQLRRMPEEFRPKSINFSVKNGALTVIWITGLLGGVSTLLSHTWGVYCLQIFLALFISWLLIGAVPSIIEAIRILRYGLREENNSDQVVMAFLDEALNKLETLNHEEEMNIELSVDANSFDDDATKRVVTSLLIQSSIKILVAIAMILMLVVIS